MRRFYLIIVGSLLPKTKKGPAQTDRSLSLYQRVYLLFNCSLRGGKACDGHTEGRARCVVHANLSTELHTAGLTTMLTTDTTAKVRTYFATSLHGVLDEFADTLLVEHLEWVYLQDLLIEVYRQERSNVVTRVTEGHLSQVVSTE